MTESLLFSYGTLRQPEVQRAVFGRVLRGRADDIAGYALAEVTITDPHVIATSGSAVHPVLVPAEPEVGVPGTVFEVDADDLVAADEYEVEDYTRVLLPLRSGADAWVYVLAAGLDQAG
ncbi:gamma-glutamylcyclotransferase family protein [Nocardia sp. AG03]|uniref:gamma-glutamylcyclotransferase family protein n=1 Tax=Nocardia sp. AG03 TaxID=3025312 RepID=UPI00241864D9|nr:gamma-glutamylcyclotransferase family protein [Nocardia sp. AG03]